MSETIVITDPDTDRYHTFSYISWWKQEVVTNATVMVVGAGALGNEVLKNLALMGIGNLLIVDFDTIMQTARTARTSIADRRDHRIGLCGQAVENARRTVAAGRKLDLMDDLADAVLLLHLLTHQVKQPGARFDVVIADHRVDTTTFQRSAQYAWSRIINYIVLENHSCCLSVNIVFEVIINYAIGVNVVMLKQDIPGYFFF